MERPPPSPGIRPLPDPPECGGCEELEGCRGGCRAVGETMYGDAYGPDPMMRIDTV